MSWRNPAWFVLVPPLCSGCGLVEDVLAWTTIQKTLVAVQAPPQVVAGTPFSVYADDEAGCGVDDVLTVTVDEPKKTLSVRISQRISRNRACPDMASLKRLSRSVTLSTPGTYQVDADTLRRSGTIDVLPAGQVAPAWTPPPLAL